MMECLWKQDEGIEYVIPFDLRYGFRVAAVLQFRVEPRATVSVKMRRWFFIYVGINVFYDYR